MGTPSNESHIILALQALENDPRLSVRKAAKLYNVSRTTLTRRQNGKHSRAEIIVKSRKLSNLEERTII